MKKNSKHNNGIIDGVIYCEDEEKKLIHDNKSKSKRDISEMFKFPDLNE